MISKSECYVLNPATKEEGAVIYFGQFIFVCAIFTVTV